MKAQKVYLWTSRSLAAIARISKIEHL